MKCNYRNCNTDLPEKESLGRNRKFCDSKCKRMEQYFREKDKRDEQGSNSN